MSLRSRSTGAAFLSSLLLLAAGVASAQGIPKPRSAGFRLHARAYSIIEVNRVWCGIESIGGLCNTPWSSIIGAAWPKNSPQGYLFNSGIQVAGTIDTAGGWAWAGDTTGAFFWDPKGTTSHGQEVEPVWNYADAEDRRNWPEAAKVPMGDASAATYDPSLQGRPTASDGDLWTMMWDGDPTYSAGRPHPYGLAVETRVLAWGYPSGNNDILYFVHTIYNITSTCAADYSGVRPAMRDRLLELGERFQGLNEAKYGIQIPACGYAMRDIWFGSAQDGDVSSYAGANYASVNIPLAMGYTYEHTFRRPDGNYALPPDLALAPFTNGYGFVGAKFLQTPPIEGTAPAIQAYSNEVSGAAFGTAQNTTQLYRYLKGAINTALGDGLCNFDITADHICFVKNDGAADLRHYMSTGPVALAPGQSVSFAVAYIFAGAVATAGCPVAGCNGLQVRPEDPTHLSNATFLTSTGANLIDSMAGFRGYSDANGDNKVQPTEFVTVRGSLMRKAQLAQVIFDEGFAVPAAPVAPDFFLVPGDAQVTILWRPSATEQTGDLFYSHASDPDSPLYDPNYRQYDLQGYRIYRGRVDDPRKLTMVAQYDHGPRDTEGHTLEFRDYLGVVRPSAQCAPELGLSTQAQGCPVDFQGPLPPGVSHTIYQSYELTSPFLQVRLGDRFLMPNGDVYLAKVDTLSFVELAGDPGIGTWYGHAPFSVVDRSVKNDLRYYYAVTAFDVNSIQSGPSSLESARVVKGVVPQRPGSNYDNTAAISIGVFGRGVNMSEVITKYPTISTANGTFSGSARPATGATIGFVGDFVKQVITEPGTLAITLDSLRLGNLDADNGCVTPGTPNHYYLTISSAAGSTTTDLVVQTDCFSARRYVTDYIDGGPIDGEQAARYGGSDDYHLMGQYTLTYPGAYYLNMNGRGCANTGSESVYGFACDYNGARWFAGPVPANNETFPHPNRGNGQNSASPGVPTNFVNAGSLPGVAVINQAMSYQTVQTSWRTVEAALSGAVRAADFNVYFGAVPGRVDSVVDYTYNVLVPFDSLKLAGSWGFLTTATAPGTASFDQTADLSLSDFSCVPGLKGPAGIGPQIAVPCPSGTTYTLTRTASLGAIRHMGGTLTTVRTRPPAAGQGFAIYLSGKLFMFELPVGGTLPANTVWSMRSYVGGISGGGGSIGSGGNDGSYSFVPESGPFTAVGASLRAQYAVTNTVTQATESDLARAHPVPDPFVLDNGWAAGSGTNVIKFVNLPVQSIVRIYSTSGVLVRVLDHNSGTLGGSLDWDVRNRGGNIVASGVYFYHIEAQSGERRVGRMTLVTSR